MTKVINENFTVGQRFVGMINGDYFTVADIRPDSRIMLTAFARELYVQEMNTQQICFYAERTGKKHWCSLGWAKRLLLTPVGTSRDESRLDT